MFLSQASSFRLVQKIPFWYTLTKLAVVAAPFALILPNPIFIPLRIQSHEPTIQRLLKVIQILWLTMSLPIRRARIVLCQTTSIV